MRRALIAIMVIFGLPAACLGFNFGADELIIDPGGLGYDQSAMDLVLDGGLTHYVFQDNRLGGSIFYLRREANGDYTTPATPVGPTGAYGSGRPRITLGDEAGELYITYAYGDPLPYHIWVVRSGDSGDNWGSPVQVDDGTGLDSNVPDIVVAPSGRVIVVWESLEVGPTSYSDIRGNYSDDNGSLWQSSDLRVNNPNTRNDEDPALDQDEAGNLLVAWTQDDGSSMNWRIYTAYSPASSAGEGYSGQTQLNQTAIMGDDLTPDVTAWGDILSPGQGVAAVAWAGTTNSSLPDIMFSVTTEITMPSGWISPGHLTPSGSATDSSPRLTNDGSGTAYCAFGRSDSGIMALLGTFTGTMTASATPSWIDDGQLAAYEPSVSCEPGGRLGVAWSDTRTGNSHPYSDQSVATLLDHFDDLTQWPGAVAVGIDCTKSVDFAGCSAEMGDSSKAEGLLDYAWSKAQNGTVVFWFWDGYTGLPGDPYMTDDWWGGVRYDDGTKAGVVRSLGIVNPGSTYSTQGESGTEDTGVVREEGWHKVEVQSEKDEEKAPAFFVYLDDVLVYQDTSFPYFEELLFQGGSGAAPYNVDELNCSTLDNDDSVPETPTLSGLGILVLVSGFGLVLRRRNRAR